MNPIDSGGESLLKGLSGNIINLGKATTDPITFLPSVVAASGLQVTGSMVAPSITVTNVFGNTVAVSNVTASNTITAGALLVTGSVTVTGGVLVSSALAAAGTSVTVGLGATSLVGFYGAAGTTQQTNGLNSATSGAGAGASVLLSTSFTGGVGTKGYTIGDLVAALKNLGLISS